MPITKHMSAPDSRLADGGLKMKVEKLSIFDTTPHRLGPDYYRFHCAADAGRWGGRSMCLSQELVRLLGTGWADGPEKGAV